jgi:hypothetical protein
MRNTTWQLWEIYAQHWFDGNTTEARYVKLGNEVHYYHAYKFSMKHRLQANNDKLGDMV